MMRDKPGGDMWVFFRAKIRYVWMSYPPAINGIIYYKVHDRYTKRDHHWHICVN